ncbi:MAG: hypothetical protein ACOC3C_04770 [Candidatus Thorarchaeota archaeon]
MAEQKPKRLKVKTESDLQEDGHEFIEGTMVRVTREDDSIVAKSVPDIEKLTEDDLKSARLKKADTEYFLSKLKPGQTKHFVKRECEETGKEFWVATSDLHQTKVCPEVREERRKEQAKERRKTRDAAKKQENEELKARVAELEAKQKKA